MYILFLKTSSLSHLESTIPFFRQVNMKKIRSFQRRKRVFDEENDQNGNFRMKYWWNRSHEQHWMKIKENVLSFSESHLVFWTFIHLFESREQIYLTHYQISHVFFVSFPPNSSQRGKYFDKKPLFAKTSLSTPSFFSRGGIFLQNDGKEDLMS